MVGSDFTETRRHKVAKATEPVVEILKDWVEKQIDPRNFRWQDHVYGNLVSLHARELRVSAAMFKQVQYWLEDDAPYLPLLAVMETYQVGIEAQVYHTIGGVELRVISISPNH